MARSLSLLFASLLLAACSSSTTEASSTTPGHDAGADGSAGASGASGAGGAGGAGGAAGNAGGSGSPSTGGAGGTSADDSPTPPNFPLIAPATAKAGMPFSVSWQVTGATTCTAAATLDGLSTSLPGWTDTTSAVSPRSVTAAGVGAYVLSMTCSNASGSVTSQDASVAVTRNPDDCPPGRQLTAQLYYNYSMPYSSGVMNADVTTFDSIWGRVRPGPTIPFPGVNYFTIIKNMNADGYIATKFTVPIDLGADEFGIMTHGETLPGPNITMSFSDTCGDFAPANPQCGPVVDAGPGQISGKWKHELMVSNGCPLTPGATYYLNFKMTNPAACANATCTVTVQNNHD